MEAYMKKYVCGVRLRAWHLVCLALALALLFCGCTMDVSVDGATTVVGGEKEVPGTIGGGEETGEGGEETGGGEQTGEGEETGEGGGGCVPGTSLPGTVPQLQITEIRTTQFGKQAEFVELKMQSSGNLGGLKVVITGNAETPFVYEFQPVQVAAGDFVVLHLRTLETSCVDEYGGNLALSGGADACPTARDFWVPGNTKHISATGAVFVLVDDSHILDAVMFSDTTGKEWKSEILIDTADYLFILNEWQSPSGEMCSPADAVNTYLIGNSVSRSIARYTSAPDTNTKADWYITPTAAVTPGY
jgi:hypothetical protein